jgi:fluoride ion exporter CrcB/FEX
MITINSTNRRPMAQVLESALVLAVITGLAIGLTFLADFCQARNQAQWLCQTIRVGSMYAYFVAAVIFCATLTTIGLSLIRNMGQRDAA